MESGWPPVWNFLRSGLETKPATSRDHDRMKEPSWFTEADRAIRAGDFAPALKVVEGWERTIRGESPGTEWDHWVYAAEIYRRLGRPEKGIRLLSTLVRPEGRRRGWHRPATDRELAEYAGNLIRIGATAEAKRHLRAVDESKAPMRPLFEGLAWIHEWDFSAAIGPLLQAYRSPHLPTYSRRIAGVNLAQSYLYSGEHEQARSLLKQLLEQSRQEGLNFLSLNLESLAATNEVLDPSELRASTAQTHLENARALSRTMSSEGSYDALVLEKASALLSLRNDRDSHALEKVRLLGHRFGQPEIVRDCDLQLALFFRDLERVHPIYFGTPFPAYRKRIERAASKAGMEILETWEESASEAESRDSVRPWDFAMDPELKPGQALFRLFQLLLGERYRRFTITNLATEIFPDAYFNFETSPDQIHQLLKRGRDFLERHSHGIAIENRERLYTLTKSADASVRHHRWHPGERPVSFRLRKIFGANEFTAADVGKRFQISQPNVSLLLREEIEQGRVVREGLGKASRYRRI